MRLTRLVVLGVVSLYLADTVNLALEILPYHQTLLAEIGLVGIKTSVPANEYNTLAEELRFKAEALRATEQGLSIREAALDERAETIAVLRAAAAALALLLALIGADAYLDYRARRQVSSGALGAA